MKRRTLFKRIGSILATLGLTEAAWLTLSDQYYQALAQSNHRKLALLIGINQYTPFPNLSGCLMDVELQKELLIYRFGFLPSDILTLTEAEASREFIETAFCDHLSKQVKPGDAVIFHFSGYGSLVKLGVLPSTMQKALVPFEPINLRSDTFANYLLEETLLALLKSLPTDKITAVLDTSYYTSSLFPSKGLGVRSLPDLARRQLVVSELEFLQRWQNSQSALSRPFVLSATSDPTQSAKEFLFADIKAGLFTYAFTQYLWETTPVTTIRTFLSHVGNTMYKLGSQQQPCLLLNNPQYFQNKSIGDYLTLELSGATGIVTDIEDGKVIQLFLVGLPPQVLEYYGANSCFTLATGERLILKSRTGLTAKAEKSAPEVVTALQVGQLVHELIRVLPQNINLLIALDPSLERIERVDATSAFSAITSVANIIGPEQMANYVFGKLQTTPSHYDLFSLGGEPLFNADGEIGEAVKVSVQRLKPKLSTLLAAKLWRLTENQGSSRLSVKATLEILDSTSSYVVMQRETAINSILNGSKKINNNTFYTQYKAIPAIPVGSRMRYQIENSSDVTVYVLLVGLNNNQSAIAFYPWQIQRESSVLALKPFLQEIVILPGQRVTIPENETTSGWLFPTRAFFCEHQLIFSTASFSKTMLALSNAKYSSADQQLISTLTNPLEVAKALLEDLHNASGVKTDINTSTSDSYVLDVNHWASLGFCFQIV